MHPIEFSQLLAALHALAPRRCLEWGSGGSTRAVLEECGFIERYVSIEHDRVWYDKVRAAVTDPRLFLHHVPADRPMPPGRHTAPEQEAWDAQAEADPAVLATYVAFPTTLGMTFDFVLVDGRARIHCIPVGFRLLRAGGLLVVHDAERREYHPPLYELGEPVFLEPWKQGQICLLRKD
jgi:hypothetical protein